MLRGSSAAARDVASPLTILARTYLQEREDGRLEQAEPDERQREHVARDPADHGGGHRAADHQQCGRSEPDDTSSPAHEGSSRVRRRVLGTPPTWATVNPNGIPTCG